VAFSPCRSIPVPISTMKRFKLVSIEDSARFVN
jgi:hypothetical protein